MVATPWRWVILAIPEKSSYAFACEAKDDQVVWYLDLLHDLHENFVWQLKKLGLWLTVVVGGSQDSLWYEERRVWCAGHLGRIKEANPR